MAHSLQAAVADGTISEMVAYCGLSPADVEKLVAHHSTAEVLVRFRSAKGDGRTKISVSELIDLANHPSKRVDGFGYRDIRDVMAVAG